MYTASDGQTFPTKEAMEAHEAALRDAAFFGSGTGLKAPSTTQVQQHNAGVAAQDTRTPAQIQQDKDNMVSNVNLRNSMDRTSANDRVNEFWASAEGQAQRAKIVKDNEQDFSWLQGDFLPSDMAGTGQALGTIGGYLAGGPLGGAAGGFALGQLGAKADRDAESIQSTRTPSLAPGYKADQGTPAEAAPITAPNETRKAVLGQFDRETEALRGDVEADSEARTQDFEENLSRLRELDTTLDTPEAAQARADQQEGLQMQRELFEELKAFDPTAFAETSADQALARSLALSRSGEGGVGARQIQERQAQDRFGEFFNQGQQQAAGIESQRLQLAKEVAGDFGQLATGTRAQDEAKAVNRAELGLSVADSITNSLNVQYSLNQQEHQLLGTLADNFARAGIDLAKMDSQEAVALLQAAVTQSGYETQILIAKLQAEAQKEGKESDFWSSLTGGLIGAGATIGAAYVAA